MVAHVFMRSSVATSDPFVLPNHGGDIAAAERRFGRPPRSWLDLSTGINPFAYPLTELDRASMERLPDQGLEAALRHTAALYYGVRETSRLVCLPGAQAAIQLLPRLRAYSRVAVVGPTYADHAASWTQAGHQVSACETLERIGDAEVVVVVNPNNPDGRRHDPGRLVEIAAGLVAKGGLMVVDEAFADVCPEISLAHHAGPGLVVLRSFGKFFGLAGLRLGFAIADEALVRLLRQVLGPWAVNGPALAIGRAALADTEWIVASRSRLEAEAAALDRLLIQFGLSIVGGTSLFRLVSAPRAWALYEHLGQRGILVRPFAAAPRWLRVGLPGGEDQRARLAEALTAWKN